MADRPTEGLHPLSSGLHLAPVDLVLARALSAQRDALDAVDAALPALGNAAGAAARAIRSGGKLA